MNDKPTAKVWEAAGFLMNLSAVWVKEFQEITGQTAK